MNHLTQIMRESQSRGVMSLVESVLQSIQTFLEDTFIKAANTGVSAKARIRRQTSGKMPTHANALSITGSSSL